MIVKFTEGIKKSFETLNTLIISALINFVNHHLIYEDSFYAFNELVTRFLGKINETKSIEGIFNPNYRYHDCDEYCECLSQSYKVCFWRALNSSIAADIKNQELGVPTDP